MESNRAEACFTFMQAFGVNHSFQSLNDRKDRRSNGVYTPNYQLHGSLEQHIDVLEELNKCSKGIFFTVCQTDLKGRKTKNITKIRAVFIDMDGGELPVFDLQPHFIVNTSPGRLHCYWLVYDMPLHYFTYFQFALAEKFNSDPSVKDLPRIMRLPGFFHHKRDPYLVNIQHFENLDRPYTHNDVNKGLQLGLSEPLLNNATCKSSKGILKKLDNKQAYTPRSGGGYDLQQNKNNLGRYGFNKGERHIRLVQIVTAIIHRNESFAYAMSEAINFASTCTPPLDESEVRFQVKDLWERYES